LPKRIFVTLTAYGDSGKARIIGFIFNRQSQQVGIGGQATPALSQKKKGQNCYAIFSNHSRRPFCAVIPFVVLNFFYGK
jgi:hypothetical protein